MSLTRIAIVVTMTLVMVATEVKYDPNAVWLVLSVFVMGILFENGLGKDND
jgi:RsiW-degrading membrane proteinase PrsW (M82 family)